MNSSIARLDTPDSVPVAEYLRSAEKRVWSIRVSNLTPASLTLLSVWWLHQSDPQKLVASRRHLPSLSCCTVDGGESGLGQWRVRDDLCLSLTSRGLTNRNSRPFVTSMALPRAGGWASGIHGLHAASSRTRVLSLVSISDLTNDGSISPGSRVGAGRLRHVVAVALSVAPSSAASHLKDEKTRCT